jgi:glucose-like phosphotransferase system IIB component
VTGDEAARSIKEKAVLYLAALGGKANIKEIGACITRLRLTLNVEDAIDEKAMKAIGATGVMRMGKNVQVVVGFEAEQIADEMKKL